jgi:hypothetical protein
MVSSPQVQAYPHTNRTLGSYEDEDDDEKPGEKPDEKPNAFNPLERAKKARTTLVHFSTLAYRIVLASVNGMASMKPREFLLVAIGLVVSLRVFLEMQLWNILVWLWTIQRPPKVVWHGLLALLIGLIVNHFFL